jgi:uncharacterized oligopeptide transporter (OPT) family protein
MTPVPRAFEWRALIFYVAFAAASAAICAQINIHLGVTPNTAVVGVLVAIAAGRSLLPQFRSPERQVMVETATSAGGFAGANIALISLAALYLLGLQRLALPLVAGIATGMAIDIWLAYRLFGTRAFPAEGPWPDGEAIGRVIQAGDEGGRLARQLLQGVSVGFIARLFSLPAAGVGIAFIGNPVALGALAIGLLLRAYGPSVGCDFATSYIAHGLMIGAGLVQVGQTAWVVWRSREGGSVRLQADRRVGPGTGPAEAGHYGGRSFAELSCHVLAFVLGAIALSGLAGLWTSMPPAQLATWIAFAGAAAFIHTIIVGYCAMLSGWFPSFAVAIALILVAALIGFPIEALAVLAGYILSTGPQFADLGYDLKSGWIIRGRGTDAAREEAGRRQQAILQEVGALVGIATVALAFGMYWKAGLVPPMGRVVATTVGLATTPALPAQLALGAILGAVAQLVGGPRRAVGILFATGLLLDNVVYGYALVAALAVRAWVGAKPMSVRAPGLIAGDGLAGFGEAITRAL